MHDCEHRAEPRVTCNGVLRIAMFFVTALQPWAFQFRSSCGLCGGAINNRGKIAPLTSRSVDLLAEDRGLSKYRPRASLTLLVLTIISLPLENVPSIGYDRRGRG